MTLKEQLQENVAQIQRKAAEVKRKQNEIENAKMKPLLAKLRKSLIATSKSGKRLFTVSFDSKFCMDKTSNALHKWKLGHIKGRCSDPRSVGIITVWW